MKRDIKNQWIEALLSGDYQQGSHFLRTDYGNGGTCSYCCLGVLCDLYLKDNEYEWDGNSYVISTAPYPPEHVVTWSGPFGDDQMEKLSAMNDIDGIPFHMIAEWIRENVPEEES